jgi:tetratricopeptide (TPR) repeat protein
VSLLGSLRFPVVVLAALMCLALSGALDSVLAQIADPPQMARQEAELKAIYDRAGRHYTAGEHAQAKALLVEGLARAQRVLGPDHVATARLAAALGEVHRSLGEYAEAEPLLKDALELTERLLGPSHIETGLVVNNIALLYAGQGRYRESLPYFQRGLGIYAASYGRGHPQTARADDQRRDGLQPCRMLRGCGESADGGAPHHRR